MTKKEFYQQAAKIYSNNEEVSNFCKQKADSLVDKKILERLAWINEQIATNEKLKK